MVVPDGQGGQDWFFYHRDGLGSVVALSKYDSQQGCAGIVERYVYDVFGAVNVCDGSGTPLNPNKSAFGNPYMFTARNYDDETGLYYYRARMYAPNLGRFLQPDPIGYNDGMNMYAYVANNPTTYVDPFGLCKGDRGFFTKLWDGDYFGTQYGANSTDIWAARAVASETWYGTAGNYFMGGLSALWTPETYKETAIVLVGSYGLRNAGRVWHLRDGTPASTVIDYGNAARLEKHMIGKGANHAARWHVDGLWGHVKHWPWKF
jgi:RHS repeat-associated protein